MRYVVLVSHGMFAEGLHDAVCMLGGVRGESTFLATGLKEGMSVDAFANSFRELISAAGPEDEIILFGDIIGGSPLSTATSVIVDGGFKDRTIVIGGMNLPLVLMAVLSKDMMSLAELEAALIPDAREAIHKLKI